MENKELESIWADGVPSKVSEQDVMKQEDNLLLCIRFFVEQVLSKDGGVILNINPNVKTYPNIIYEKNNKKYGICIVPCIYPYFSFMIDKLRISFVNESVKHNIIPVMSCVLMASYDKQRADKQLLLKGDLFNLRHIGNYLLNNDEKIMLTPNDLTYIFE